MTAVARKHHPAPRWRQSPPIADRLLGWYDQRHRDLPWRVAAGSIADPYAVWLSEVMLQQTTVKAVVPYYREFLARWPTVTALAAADRDDVMRVWAGLGYYSRARNLHACAKAVVELHGGVFPRHEAELLKLPGVGPYTAAAIAAIAYGEPTTPVDGNVERVVSRLFAVETPLPEAKPELRGLAASLTPGQRTGDYAQAMMDLGATVCTPRRPSCMMCPIEVDCIAKARGIAEVLPYRSPKGDRPLRRGAAFVALNETGEVLLRQRPEEGLLAAMMEVPTTEWSEDWPGGAEAFRVAPLRANWWQVPAPISHTFTHFRLELTVYRALVPAKVALTLWAGQERCRWVHRRELDGEALPSVMRKVIAAALETPS